MKAILFLPAVLLNCQLIFAQVMPYPFTKDVPQSIHYQVKANGKSIGTYDSPVVAYSAFDMQGKVELEIRADRDIKWVDIRPKSLNIQPNWKDSILHFSIENPCNLSIELNGEPLNFPLFLFANSPEPVKPDVNDPDVIFFEAGKVHKPGIITLKSNQTIYIGGGAVVEAAISAKDARDITVRGRGVLLGTYIKTYNPNKWTRFVNFENCRNIAISDIILIDSHSWQIVPINCDSVTIQNVRIVSDNGGDDGLDICRSRNVNISGCFIRTKDDCIAIKSNFQYPDSIITDGISISNCTLWNTAWGNGFEIGFELVSDEVRNISFTNSDIIRVDKGAALSIHNGDKAKVSNVLFEDIRIEDCNQKLIDLAIFYNQYAADKPVTKEEREKRYLRGAWDGVMYLTPDERKEHAQYRGSIENITFRNISVTDGIFPFSIFCGYDENHMVKNITIENLRVHGRKIITPEDGRIYSEFTDGIKIF